MGRRREAWDAELPSGPLLGGSSAVLGRPLPLGAKGQRGPASCAFRLLSLLGLLALAAFASTRRQEDGAEGGCEILLGSQDGSTEGH